MKPEEVVEKVRRVKSLYAYESDYEALDMAIEAIEKQIPRKPKYTAEDRFVKNHFVEYSYCPMCEKEVFAGDMHCVQCGQAIDWLDGEG